MSHIREQTQHSENYYDVQIYEKLGRCTYWYDTISINLTVRGYTEKLQQLPCRVNAYAYSFFL